MSASQSLLKPRFWWSVPLSILEYISKCSLQFQCGTWSMFRRANGLEPPSLRTTSMMYCNTWPLWSRVPHPGCSELHFLIVTGQKLGDVQLILLEALLAFREWQYYLYSDIYLLRFYDILKIEQARKRQAIRARVELGDSKLLPSDLSWNRTHVGIA